MHQIKPRVTFVAAQNQLGSFGRRKAAMPIHLMRDNAAFHRLPFLLIPLLGSAMAGPKRNFNMSHSPTSHQTFLAPLAKLALRHPDVEGQAIWWEDGEWQAQDDAEEMIDGEEIAYYAEGLLSEGFGLCWQVLAEADAPKDPTVVLLFLWQEDETPDFPPPGKDWVILATATTPAA